MVHAEQGSLKRPNIHCPNFFGLLTPGPLAAVRYLEVGYVIFVESETTPAHQAHLIAHELAHILLGTVTSWGDGPPPSTPAGGYDTLNERDAEFVGRLITTGIRATVDARLPYEPDPRIERLGRALKDRITWA